MPNEVDVNIKGHDNLSPEMRKAARKAEQEAKRLQSNIKNTFQNIGQNILSSVGGPLGGIASQIANIKHPVAIAAASITALAGGFALLANRAAEATKETSVGSRSFLVGMENLKTRVSDNLNLIGSKAIGVFNSFFEVIGTGATKQQLLNAETKRYNDLIVTTVSKTDEYVAKIKEFLIATDRLDEATITRDYFEAIVQGRTELANAYAQQLANLKILQVETPNAAANEKRLMEENARKRKELEEAAAKRRKELAEDIMGTIKKLGETEREEMRQSIEAADRALQKDRTEFQESLERQRAGLKSPEDVERAVNEERQKGKEALRESVQLQNEMVNAIGQSAIQAKNFSDFLQKAVFSVIAIVARAALMNTPLGFLGGLLPFQHGGIVQRPTRALIGEAGPEAIVPLSPGKAPQREAVMQAAGLTGGGGSVTLNISMPNIRSVDPITVRNVLLPEFNRQVRRGEKLLSSKLR